MYGEARTETEGTQDSKLGASREPYIREVIKERSVSILRKEKVGMHRKEWIEESNKWK